MRAYSVHAPPLLPDEPERFAFVKDGISWPALFVPALWILWHRLWLTLIAYIIFVLLLAWIDRLTGETNAAIIGLLGSILFALEANNIRRLSLTRRGWREAGSAFGQNLEEGEIRFFQGWGAAAAPRSIGKGEAARAAYRPSQTSDEDSVFGLFPEADR